MVREKQLILVSLVEAFIISLLFGCADETAESVGYKSRKSIEHVNWLTNEQSKIIDSMSQTYNKQAELSSKLINNQLEKQNSDIDSMNERYSYSQNLTDRGFLPR